ncbi:MAG: phosphoglycolate phosphatase [Oricola sp.]
MSSAALPGIVFDLDGTLIESAPAIMAVGNTLLAENGLPPLTLTETRSYIGNGAAKFVERAFSARGLHAANEKLEAAYERFEFLYGEADPLDNLPMPGVDSALRALAANGFPLGICTNKPGIPTLSVITAIGWADLLKVIVSGDSLSVKKPDPGPLFEAQRLLGTASILYVGDSDVDAETARRAEVPLLLYTEGYRKSAIGALPHRAAFSNFEDLPELVRSVLASPG